MKKNIVFCCIILALVLLVGCSNVSHENNNSNEDIVSTIERIPTLSQYNSIFSNEVIFYWLERDTFECFTANPSYDFLKSNNMSVFRYTEESPYFFHVLRLQTNL